MSERWEYLVVDENNPGKIKFEELGAAGWELVAVTGHGAQNKILAVFKRRA